MCRALDGVPLQPWVQRCTAVIPGVCAGEPAGAGSRSDPGCNLEAEVPRTGSV